MRPGAPEGSLRRTIVPAASYVYATAPSEPSRVFSRFSAS
jgi:hypothetical protein